MKAVLAIANEATQDDMLKKQTKFNQNVHVHIDQVTTNDPQRWLVELNDIVQQRARAPIAARRGWKPNPNK